MFLDPTDDSAGSLLSRGIAGPFLMLNLLRFRAWADYTGYPQFAPSQPISGRAAYDLYVDHTLPFLAATGGSVSLLADGGPFFVGPSDERWDVAMVIRQASIEDFFAFASNLAYLAGVCHRTAAVEDSRLLPLVERSPTTPASESTR
ncbi:MAG: hypothetical protein QOE89_2359 [Pseudonocardiales bacterium]|jgi:hypothetical protein|nr:hypothetical protein [Pseudonocardiales bacterium]